MNITYRINGVKGIFAGTDGREYADHICEFTGDYIPKENIKECIVENDCIKVILQDCSREEMECYADRVSQRLGHYGYGLCAFSNDGDLSFDIFSNGNEEEDEDEEDETKEEIHKRIYPDVASTVAEQLSFAMDSDTASKITDKIADDVVDDIIETANLDYSYGDVSLAIGRVLKNRLGID